MRGYCILIKSNQYKRYIFHFNKPAFLKRDSKRSLLSESDPCSFIGTGETNKIKSNPPARRSFTNLKASRPRRLARFLETAFHKLPLGALKKEKQIRL